MGYRFDVTLRIFNPQVCKQCLRLKMWKGWSKSRETKRTQD